MNIHTWLVLAQSVLDKVNIGTARLDTLVLLEDVIGKDRSWLLANPDYEISSEQEHVLQKLLKRRASHEPLAYIRQKSEFYGREFVITPAVLEPRPESETMIDLLKSTLKASVVNIKLGQKLHLVDVGTGSGALGITAKLELPDLDVTLLDIDSKVLEVAKINVDKFTLDISIVASDLLCEISQPCDILLCNLPYVPDDFHINLAASKEPRLAIFGGPDGLEQYRRLFKQVSDLPIKPLYILTEALPTQHKQLAEIAEAVGYRHLQADDFIQVFITTNSQLVY